MTDAQAELAKTIVWALAFVFGLQAFGCYAIVRLVILGSVFPKREQQQPERSTLIHQVPR